MHVSHLHTYSHYLQPLVTGMAIGMLERFAIAGPISEVGDIQCIKERVKLRHKLSCFCCFISNYKW